MEKRILGKTGWSVSTISFGAIKLPRISLKECEILLNRALDSGINYIDTAHCYGDSEDWAKEQCGVLASNVQACSDCRTCIEKCPYGVPIPAELRQAHKILKST